MVFLILDQICPSVKPTVLLHGQRKFFRAPNSAPCRAPCQLHHCLGALPRLLLGSAGGLAGSIPWPFHVEWMLEGDRIQARKWGCILAGYPRGLLGAHIQFISPPDGDENYPELDISGELTISGE